MSKGSAGDEPFKMPGLPVMTPPARPAKSVRKKTESPATQAAEPDRIEIANCQAEADEGAGKEQEACLTTPPQPTAASLAAVPEVVSLAPSLRLSPAELAQAKAVPLPYQEPSWGGVPAQPYGVEVIKNGTVVETIPLRDKSFFVIGRLATCDIVLEHPSLSR